MRRFWRDVLNGLLLQASIYMGAYVVMKGDWDFIHLLIASLLTMAFIIRIRK